jgi:sugar lactone lactonase YvrE
MKQIFIFLTLAVASLSLHGQTLTFKWKTDTLLRVPESVYFDQKNKILYVANINGKSNEKDGNGFISQVTTDGKIKKLQWVTGLDAPKGMGLVGNTLYVADLTRVVAIDIGKGSITKTYEIEGAQFLNDITTDEQGNVYISDSATGKIHRIANDKVEVFFESPEFKRINGLLALKNGLYIADAGNGVNYKLSKDKQLTKFGETAEGADGIVNVGQEEYIVSSWGGEVYFINAGGVAVKMLDTKDKKLNSADIAYDGKSHIVFVPTFFGNSIMAYQFKR